MQAILYLLFATVLTVDYFDKILHVVPGHLELIPEVLSFIVTIIILGQLSKTKKFNLGIKYIIIFTLLAMHMVNGILLNTTPTVAVVVGLRLYLKYIPFFILPLVYDFDEEQILRIFKLILVICLLQLPVALYQRFVYATNVSGDWVRGTLTTSSILSMVLISTISMVLAFYLKGRIKLKQLIILFVILFIPNTINETKGTLILLPIALAVPLLLVSKQERKGQSILPIVLMASLMFGGFVVAYDTFWGERYERVGGSVLDFFTSDRIVRYLAPRTSDMVDGEEGSPVGKIDKIVAPIKVLSKDPVQLLIGVGVGNVTPSPIRSLAAAEYIDYFKQNLVGTSIGFLIWEVGLIGLFLSLIFIYFVHKDARYLSSRSDIEGVIGLGWSSVTIIIGISLFYKDIIPSNGIMYTFWFFSGYIVSRRESLKRSMYMESVATKISKMSINKRKQQ
jgi:hypothetical protein